MAWNFWNSDTGGSGDGTGSGTWGGSGSGGDDIGRTYGFARNMNTFLSAGSASCSGGAGSDSAEVGGVAADGSALATGRSPESGAAGGAAIPGASAPGAGDSGGLSPLQRLQLDGAKKLNGFLDAGRNWQGGTSGYAGNAWETSGRNGNFGLGDGQAGTEPRNMGAPAPGSGAAGEGSATATSDEQRQRENRDFFNRWKGLPTQTPEERAKARGDCAEDKLNFNQADYKPEKYGIQIGGLDLRQTHWKCNEFVSDVHRQGDPDGYRYPTRLNDGGTLWSWTGHGPLDAPTVSDLANPDFAKGSLDYFEDGNQLKFGDIIVWHNPERKIHHSAIYVGNGEVIQAGLDGLGRRKLEEVTNGQKGIIPVYRRAR